MEQRLKIAILIFSIFPAMMGNALPAVAPGVDTLGAWWKDSEIVRDLVLTKDQIQQIEQAFLDRRQALNDSLEELNRQESVLQALVESGRPDERSVASQVDRVVSARGRLEKENTMLVFAVRRAISAEQWARLQELQRNASHPAAATITTVDAAPQKTNSRNVEEPVYAVGGAVFAPVPLRSPLPPSEMRSGEDVIVFQAVVGKDRVARNARILRSTNKAVSDWLIKSIGKQWDFRPGTLQGRYVSVLTTIGITFHNGKADVWWDR